MGTKSPPRVRGWSRDGYGVPRLDGVSPACAGMVPGRKPTTRSPRSLPRVRGDGPIIVVWPLDEMRSPPRARGWSGRDDAYDHESVSPPRARGWPVHAGRWARLFRRLPRVRGDGPDVVHEVDGSKVSPPRARGWPVHRPHQAIELLVSPACAGMAPRRRRDRGPTCRLPRVRGDGPQEKVMSNHEQNLPRVRGDGPVIAHARTSIQRCPPRARGWSAHHRREPVVRHVSPACAGMAPRRSPRTSTRNGFPRVRGDGPKRSASLGPHGSSPPRARGWSPAEEVDAGLTVVSPARAGMVRCSALRSRRVRCIPRVRGDGPQLATHKGQFPTAPPRARGWPGAGLGRLRGDPGSPACAGMVRTGTPTSRASRYLPLVRGDGPPWGIFWLLSTTCPPRARGWPGTVPPATPKAGVSPACAGMARNGTVATARDWRFTRVRGDGPIPRCRPILSSAFPRVHGDGPKGNTIDAQRVPSPPRMRDGPMDMQGDPFDLKSPRAGMAEQTRPHARG